MALNQSLLQCTGCHDKLNLDSKTLPCLHSFCHSCLDSNFEGQTNGNGQCPECQELLTLDQLTLSPFLVKSLRLLQLESTDWKCDLCSEDGIESTARNWCHDCQKLFCANCSRCHKKLQRKHNARDLDGMERSEAIKVMTTDMCYLHQKAKDSYCKQCNICFCDTCYQNHSIDSPECSSQPLSVREESLKQKSQGPTLAKDMDDLEISLRGLNERTKNYTEELNSDCDSKCKQMWLNFEEMMENAKQKTEELCEEMRQITTEQVKMWHHLLQENEKILKQLEIWRLNLHHLLGESQQDVDVVCGLQLLGSKLSSQLNKSVGSEEKCQLRITFPNWWLQVLEQLKSEKIGSVSWTGGTLPAAKNLDELPAEKNLELHNQWNLNRSNLNISFIYVTKEDNRIFLGDKNDSSIIGFTEFGKFFCECVLFDGENQFQPTDMCSMSSDSLIVSCQLYTLKIRQNKLMILERRRSPPFLKIKQIIDVNYTLFTLCQVNKTIIACDLGFKIYSITNGGENINIIRPAVSRCQPRIHADPSTGNFWGTKNYSEITCYTLYGEKIQSLVFLNFSDFCVNEFGHFYFCNVEGIFSLSPKNFFWKFEKESEVGPRILVLRQKLFVSLKINGKWLFKIFKILD